MTGTTYSFPLKGRRVWVAGHRGLVGSALCRRLERESCDILTVPREELDLTRQADVEAWMAENRPQAVFIAAAKVGGIFANDNYPAQFLYQNLSIQTNIVHAAWKLEVEKVMLLGSSCTYPKMAPQPIAESSLMEGPLEPTNQWYSVAKIAGVKMCEAYRKEYGCDFISVMPANLYGPGDNFDPVTGHVIPGLIRRFHEAKVNGAPWVEIWGTGTPRREFLHVDDMADGCIHLMERYSEPDLINLGTEREISIGETARLIAQVVGYPGELRFNTDKPDGAPRKVLKVEKLAGTGWRAGTDFEAGLRQTYSWFQENILPTELH